VRLNAFTDAKQGHFCVLLKSPKSLLIAVLVGITTSACGDPPTSIGRSATLEGRVYVGLTPLSVSGATVTVHGKSATTSATGTYRIEEVDTGDAKVSISRTGYLDATFDVALNDGVNTKDFPLDQKADSIVIGDSNLLMTGPGVARAAVRIYGLDVEVTPVLTTTGPFVAAYAPPSRPYLRAITVTATSPGTGTVTFTARGVTGTLSVEAVALKFKSIDMNTLNVCGIALDDSAWCWGGNNSGQLGYSTLGVCNGGACQYGGHEGAASPLPVQGGFHFSGIATLGYVCTPSPGPNQTCGSTCALTAAGEPWCWGTNGVSVDTVPKAIAGLSLKTLAMRSLEWIYPAQGPSAWCGLRTDGSAVCFTRNSVTPVAPGMTFQSFSVARTHSCGIDLTGDAYCWGDNSQGALGIGGFDADKHDAPLRVSGTVKFTDIDAGIHSTCALASSGTIYCWGIGYSSEGELSPSACTASVLCQTTPRALPGSRVYVKFARGDRTLACGAVSSGAVDCWTSFNATPAIIPVPALVSVSVGNGSGAPYFSSGVPYDACGLASDGTAYCWRGTNVSKIAHP
jgi:hypothetical protein